MLFVCTLSLLGLSPLPAAAQDDGRVVIDITSFDDLVQIDHKSVCQGRIFLHTIMRKLIQLTIFLGWISAMVWAGLELEKIKFFQSLLAGVM